MKQRKYLNSRLTEMPAVSRSLRARNHHHPRRPVAIKAVGFILVAFLLFLSCCLLTKTPPSELSTDSAANAVIALLLAAAAFLALIQSKRVDRIAATVKQRSALCKFLAIIILGTLVSYCVSSVASDELERQADIAERETAPLLKLTEEKGDDGKSVYVLTNTKGLASYVSFSIEERGMFLLNGESYALFLELPVKPLNDDPHFDKDNTQLSFRLDRAKVNHDVATKTATNILNQIAPSAGPISFSREITVSFFDHKNTQMTLVYIETPEGIKLNSSGQRYYPTHNRAVRLEKDWTLNQALNSLLPGLVEQESIR